MRILLLSNTRAGSSARSRPPGPMAALLRSEGAKVEIRTPASAEETRSLASEAGAAGYDVLLARGGDGTLNAVANGLARSDRRSRPPLAILPAGRGNDFAADVGIERPEDTLRAIRENRRRHVDLGECNGGFFLGVAGTGFDARAARRARETPLLSGRLLYTYAVVRTLVDYDPVVAKVRYDGGTFEGAVTFAAVGNSSRYGGGMRITPRAELSDGLLDLCLVRAVSKATLLRVFPSVFAGRHLEHAKVDYRKTSFVEIETREPIEVFADGEPLAETPTRIGVVPDGLEVFALR